MKAIRRKSYRRKRGGGRRRVRRGRFIPLLPILGPMVGSLIKSFIN